MVYVQAFWRKIEVSLLQPVLHLDFQPCLPKKGKDLSSCLRISRNNSNQQKKTGILFFDGVYYTKLNNKNYYLELLVRTVDRKSKEKGINI